MGGFLEDLFGKVFKGSDKVPVNHKENFTIKDQDWKELKNWEETEEANDLMALIFKNIHLKKAGIAGKPQTHLFESRYANGFAITYDEPLDSKSFSNLFLAFSQRVIDLGYKQISLDRKLEEINQQVKVTEKFYFKPPLQKPTENELISQLYGNISLEKITIDNQPSYLKFLATVYSDRLFQNAKPFDQLLDRLFNIA